MQTVAYVPAGVSWTANIHDCVRVRPSLYCDFDPAFFRDVTGLEGDDSPQFLEACLSVSTPAMLQALWLLHDEVRNPGFAHAVSVDALCRVVLVEVGRHFRRGGANPHASSDSRMTPAQLTRVREFVDGAEGRHVTIADLGQLCGISPSHFRRLFKATTGTTISQYIESARLGRARAMLADQSIPLKQIAYQLGFSSPSAFSHAFKREAGITPLSYRRQAGV